MLIKIPNVKQNLSSKIQSLKSKMNNSPGPVSCATVPVTTKIPAPMEAPTPIRMRSKRPRRRIKPSPEFTRTEVSVGGARVLALRADDQKLEKNDELLSTLISLSRQYWKEKFVFVDDLDFGFWIFLYIHVRGFC